MLKISNKIFTWKGCFLLTLSCYFVMSWWSLFPSIRSTIQRPIMHDAQKNVSRRFSSEKLMIMVLRNCCRVGITCSFFRQNETEIRRKSTIHTADLPDEEIEEIGGQYLSWITMHLTTAMVSIVMIIIFISKIQLVVHHQGCVLIGWATTRLYVIAH